MATTTQPTAPFYQPVKSSEIENQIVNAEEAEAMEADDKLFYAFIPFPGKCWSLWREEVWCCEGEVICHKSSTVLSEPKFGPPQ